MTKNPIFEKVNTNLNNKFSIRSRIALWYLISMGFIVIIYSGLFFYITNNIVRKSTYTYLKERVNKSFSSIRYIQEDKELEIDDNLQTLNGSIQLSIFNNQKEFIYGNSPLNFKFDDTLSDNGKVRILKHKNQRWYLYEEKHFYKGYGDLWVRGVVESSVLEYTIEAIFFITLVGLPILLIFITIGGYIFSKQLFKPISKITEIAQEINDGDDLTKRINLGNGKDEIYNLANTFDNMFDKLQKSFENEVQFTSDVSHELRTPISVIMTQSEYGKDIEMTPEEAKHTFNIIFKESKKMSQLVSQLLTLVRIDKGHLKLNLENIDIGELLEISLETQQINANKKNINFITNIEENIFTFIDEIMILRAFNNIISNAIFYGKENGFLKISSKKENNKIFITFEDNGIGISKENLDKIWIRFFQADSSRTTDNSGLGLPMVKGIIEAHNGNISVTSELGKGTTFSIILPFLEKI